MSVFVASAHPTLLRGRRIFKIGVWFQSHDFSKRTPKTPDKPQGSLGSIHIPGSTAKCFPTRARYRHSIQVQSYVASFSHQETVIPEDVDKQYWKFSHVASRRTPRTVHFVIDDQPSPAQPNHPGQPAIPGNPFASFCHADNSSDDEDELKGDLDDEPPSLVFSQLVFGESIVYGQQRMSDGTSVMASGYRKAADGFIVCVFPDESTLPTDIPNEYVAPSGEFICRPIATIPPKKQKAKAKAAASEQKAEGEGKGEDEGSEEAEGADAEGEEPEKSKGGKGKGKKAKGKAKPLKRPAALAKKDDGKMPDAKTRRTVLTRQKLVEIMQQLPKDAQISEEELGQKKSYTLKHPLHNTNIGIILYDQTLYVKPLTKIPEIEGKPICAAKINKFGGVQMSFKQDAHEMWELAKQVAGWS